MVTELKCKEKDLSHFWPRSVPVFFFLLEALIDESFQEISSQHTKAKCKYAARVVTVTAIFKGKGHKL